MKNYRPYNPVTDKADLFDLCKKFNVDVPKIGYLIVHEQDGKIDGVIGLKTITFIEPLIAKNALVADKLYQLIESEITEKKLQVVQCICDPKYEDEFNKKGFFKVEAGKVILEKTYSGV
jgi:hypothetical protein